MTDTKNWTPMMRAIAQKWEWPHEPLREPTCWDLTKPHLPCICDERLSGGLIMSITRARAGV